MDLGDGDDKDLDFQIAERAEEFAEHRYGTNCEALSLTQARKCWDEAEAEIIPDAKE